MAQVRRTCCIVVEDRMLSAFCHLHLVNFLSSSWLSGPTVSSKPRGHRRSRRLLPRCTLAVFGSPVYGRWKEEGRRQQRWQHELLGLRPAVKVSTARNSISTTDRRNFVSPCCAALALRSRTISQNCLPNREREATFEHLLGKLSIGRHDDRT